MIKKLSIDSHIFELQTFRNMKKWVLGFLLIVSSSSFQARTSSEEGKKPVKYLALGDSYTIGTALEEGESYVHKLQKLMEKGTSRKVNIDIVAKNGWTTTDLLTALEQDPPQEGYDIVSLLIGVNNQYQKKAKEEYRTEFRTLLEKSIELACNDLDKVFVISIPDYGVTPYAAAKRKGIARDIDVFNQINKEISDSLHVQYIDITGISRRGYKNPEMIAGDDLHFSGQMHTLWANRIMKIIKGRVYP